LLFQEPVTPPPPSSETEQIAPPSLGDTILEKIIYYLNYPFVNQREFKVSVLSLMLLIVVIIIAWLVSRYARRFLKTRILPKSHIDIGLQYTLLRVLHYIVITVGIIYGLKVGFSIDLTSVAVILGFLSVGIGFGLQYIASDMVSGFILLFERPVRVGDRIKIDDVEGRVANIRVRSTLIITNENMAVIVPNSQLVQRKFINWSYNDEPVRIDVPIGVAYGSDLQKVSAALVQAAKSVKEVLAEPPPRPHFKGFGDSALDFQIRVWINEPHKHPQIRSKLNFQIDRVFREQGIEIPFPQRDLRLRAGAIRVDQRDYAIDEGVSLDEDRRGT
jgi:small-conductance mechanosensitive channel